METEMFESIGLKGYRLCLDNSADAVAAVRDCQRQQRG